MWSIVRNYDGRGNEYTGLLQSKLQSNLLVGPKFDDVEFCFVSMSKPGEKLWGQYLRKSTF